MDPPNVFGKGIVVSKVLLQVLMQHNLEASQQLEKSLKERSTKIPPAGCGTTIKEGSRNKTTNPSRRN